MTSGPHKGDVVGSARVEPQPRCARLSSACRRASGRARRHADDRCSINSTRSRGYNSVIFDRIRTEFERRWAWVRRPSPSFGCRSRRARSWRCCSSLRWSRRYGGRPPSPRAGSSSFVASPLAPSIKGFDDLASTHPGPCRRRQPARHRQRRRGAPACRAQGPPTACQARGLGCRGSELLRPRGLDPEAIARAAVAESFAAATRGAARSPSSWPRSTTPDRNGPSSASARGALRPEARAEVHQGRATRALPEPGVLRVRRLRNRRRGQGARSASSRPRSRPPRPRC